MRGEIDAEKQKKGQLNCKLGISQIASELCKVQK